MGTSHQQKQLLTKMLRATKVAQQMRSLLFVPGNVRHMLEKVVAFPTDVLVPDLEDSVNENDKSAARQLVREMLPQFSVNAKSRLVFPRVNGPETQHIHKDIQAMVSSHIQGISVGKVESSAHLKAIDEMLLESEELQGLAKGSLHVIPWIESAKGVSHAMDICEHHRVCGVAFGVDDFSMDMGVPRQHKGRESLFDYARHVISVAARANGVLAFDTPWVKFKDLAGLEADCAVSRCMGFQGKFSIHPSNVAVIDAAFSPSATELAQAQLIVDTYEEAVRQNNRGSVSVEGIMVDAPVYGRAKNLLAAAKSASDPSKFAK
eukprot:c6087_g1_i1.p1 GENE.c6087_g1_i1~~c6087_g1_i1.p1  ORF type:complete len:320 (-),score=82.72 c6087_g1_i1:282-1241(-)